VCVCVRERERVQWRVRESSVEEDEKMCVCERERDGERVRDTMLGLGKREGERRSCELPEKQ